MSEDVDCCPICGSAEFRGPHREKCANCGSKGRTRSIFVLLSKLGALQTGYSALHLAPEPALVPKLAESYGGGYAIADIRAEALDRFDDRIAKLVLDISNMDEKIKAKRFDIVIHSHVMEHVRGSWPLAFLRLHSLLNPGGWHIFAVPIKRDWSKEDLAPLTAGQRAKRYGQHDHMRWIGRNDFNEDMRNMADLTGAEYFRPVTAFLSEHEMRQIAGNADVYVMRKAHGDAAVPLR